MQHLGQEGISKWISTVIEVQRGKVHREVRRGEVHRGKKVLESTAKAKENLNNLFHCKSLHKVKHPKSASMTRETLPVTTQNILVF